jgi:cytidylate kinase
MPVINVAVDGPAGAGKSSVSRSVAHTLGFIYVDTGALYRAVGLSALRQGIDTKDACAVAAMLDGTHVSLRFVDGEQRVFLGEEDVSDAIRTPQASMAASNVSAVPAVREFLFALQQEIAAQNNCLMDGRDIGTVVLPNADVKIFLTASIEERALRRWKEMKAKGYEEPIEKLAAEIEARDKADSERAISPLVRVPEATLLDSTGMTIDEVVQKVMELCG